MAVAERGMALGRLYERVRGGSGLARDTAVVVALLVIAGVVGGIILGNQRFVWPWAQRMVVYASFAATPGISPGNGQEVRIAGVNVGDVVTAQIDPHGHAVLKLSLEPGHMLYKNATLVLRPKSPLNEMYVEIAPGGAPADPVPAGYEFPISNTQRPVEVDEVLDHLDTHAQQALTALLSESDVALTHAASHLPQGLDATRAVGDDLRPVAEQLAMRIRLIRTLITDLAIISKAVGGDDTRIATLAGGLQTTLGSLGSHQPQMESALATLPGLLDNLQRSTDAVQRLSGQLDPTLRDLADASHAFPRALRRLDDTSDHVSEVVDAAQPFLHRARPVLEDLRPFTDDLHDALPALRGATRQLDPLTNALLPYLPDAAAFAINTRSITSTEDANYGVLRAQLLISPYSLPGVFGPGNGIPAISVPQLDQGTTTLQKTVPR